MLARYRPELVGTEAARRTVRYVLDEPDLPLAARDHVPADALVSFLASYPGRVLIAADSAGRREALLEILHAGGLRPVVLPDVPRFVAAGDLVRLPYLVMEYVHGRTVQHWLDGPQRPDADTLARLDTFAAAFGLAFQVRDDLLDIEASSEQLGKTAGKDVAQAKSTYPALLGLDGARARLGELATSMRDALAPFGARAAALAALGELAVRRSH